MEIAFIEIGKTRERTELKWKDFFFNEFEDYAKLLEILVSQRRT